MHSPFGQHDCESCHGPSAAHATGFAAGNPQRRISCSTAPNASPVAERNQICLSCHQDSKRMDWGGSQHQNANLACVSCHESCRQGSHPGEGDAAGKMLHLPCAAARGELPVFASPDARRQSDLQRLPQSARLGRSEAARKNSRSTRLATIAMPRSAARCCGNTSRFARIAELPYAAWLEPAAPLLENMNFMCANRHNSRRTTVAAHSGGRLVPGNLQPHLTPLWQTTGRA